METTPLETLTMNSKQKPIHEVRLGSIKAAVWKNDTENGTRYNFTFSRLYKDQDQWQSTDNFGRDDLLVIAKVADSALPGKLSFWHRSTKMASYGYDAMDVLRV